MNKKTIIKPPPPPLSRIMREGSVKICPNCGSTMNNRGYMLLFGEFLCDNPQCPNSNYDTKLN